MIALDEHSFWSACFFLPFKWNFHYDACMHRTTDFCLSFYLSLSLSLPCSLDSLWLHWILTFSLITICYSHCTRMLVCELKAKGHSSSMQRKIRRRMKQWKKFRLTWSNNNWLKFCVLSKMCQFDTNANMWFHTENQRHKFTSWKFDTISLGQKLYHQLIEFRAYIIICTVAEMQWIEFRMTHDIYFDRIGFLQCNLIAGWTCLSVNYRSKITRYMIYIHFRPKFPLTWSTFLHNKNQK